MPFQFQGFSGNVPEVSSGFSTLRTVEYPIHPGALGAFSVASVSGIMIAGQAANSEIFQFRNAGTNLVVLRSIWMGATTDTVPFTTGTPMFFAKVARSWTTTGGASGMAFLVHQNNDNKKRTSFGASSIATGDIRMSVTSGLLAGTKTFDLNPFSAVVGQSHITSVNSMGAPALLVPQALWTRDTTDEYPFVFAQNEGFSVLASVTAVGTWKFSIRAEWAELTSY
jgi:hypothetical protein